MPPPVAPQTRPDLADYTVQNVFTNALGLIDGDRLQKVLLYMQASFANLLTDGVSIGGIGTPDYLALLAALSGKADKDPLSGLLVQSQAPPAAPDWAPGKQAGGALVFYQGIVYRVKQNIANGQSPPAGNITYYLPIGPGAGSGSASDGILFLPDGRAILSPAAQAQLDAGELYWLHDDGTGYRQMVTAGTSPTQTATQNSQALISMANGLAKP